MGGNTSINLTLAGVDVANPLVTNVANLNIRAASASSILANAGYAAINNASSSGTLAVTAINSNAALGFSNYSTAATSTDSASFTFAADTLGSATATITLNLSGVGTATATPDVEIITAGADVIKTMNIVGGTAATNIAVDGTSASTTLNAWNAVRTMNISGGAFRIVGANGDSLDSVTTINASTNTGGANIDLKTGGNSQSVTFTGGTGNDRISFAAGQFNINDVVTMGTGTDTLALADKTITIAGAPTLITAIKAVTGLEILELTSAGAAASASMNSLKANDTGLTQFLISGAVTADAGAAAGAGTIVQTITGQTNSMLFTISANQTGGVGGAAAANSNGQNGGTAVSIAASLDNGSNALTLTLGDAVAATGVTLTGGLSTVKAGNGTIAGLGGVGLTASNFETLNLVTTGGTAVLVGGSSGDTVTQAGAGLIVSTNATINVSGSQNLTLGPVKGDNVNIVAAADYTKTLTVATLEGNATITSGGGNDVLLSVAGAKTATINAGAGNDTVSILGIGNFVSKTATVETAAAATSVQDGASTHGDSITLGAGTDTVKYMAATFANMLKISAGETRVTSIKDFTVGADKIALVASGGVNTSISLANNQTIASADTLAEVYTGMTAIGASTAGGAASAVVLTVTAGARAGTYLYVNDATGGVAAADDMLINITGIQGTLSASDFVFA